MNFDENGNLKINTLEENNQEYKEKYREKFGDVDLSSSSALGEDLAITSEMKKIVDENSQEAITQNNPFLATGLPLENLAFLAGGLKKLTNVKSTVLLKFSGPNGSLIAKGTLVEEQISKEKYETTLKGTISNGIFYTFAQALTAGEIPCDKNQLNKLVTPVEGITVINESTGDVGFIEETNTALRKRMFDFDNSLNINERLYMKLKNIPNVKKVKMIPNKTDAVDANGIPAGHIAIIVLGGEDDLIAKAIFEQPVDYNTFGNIKIFVSSKIMNTATPVNFIRPNIVAPTVQVILNVDSSYNPNDATLIKESLLAYFKDKYSMGSKILIDNLAIPVQENYLDNNSSFKGLDSVTIKINNLSKNLILAYDQLAYLNFDNIQMEVYEV